MITRRIILMIRIFQKITGKLLDFFFPPECLSCAKEDFWICPGCINKIEPDIARLSGEEHEIGRLCALTDYNIPLIRNALKRLKFGFCRPILHDLAPFLQQALTATNIPLNAVFCPVPLHFRRKNERGFNQAELIAQSFAEITRNRIVNILKRQRYTVPQSSLDSEQRRKNLCGAFSVKGGTVEKIGTDTPVILVDDVATTFSTLTECARTLREAGFTDVSAIVIARSPLRRTDIGNQLTDNSE